MNSPEYAVLIAWLDELAVATRRNVGRESRRDALVRRMRSIIHTLAPLRFASRFRLRHQPSIYSSAGR
jgi:hypothetical protein